MYLAEFKFHTGLVHTECDRAENYSFQFVIYGPIRAGGCLQCRYIYWIRFKIKVIMPPIRSLCVTFVVV